MHARHKHAGQKGPSQQPPQDLVNESSASSPETDEASATTDVADEDDVDIEDDEGEDKYEDEENVSEGSMDIEELDDSDAPFESDDENMESLLQRGEDQTAFIDHGNMPWALMALKATEKVLASAMQSDLQLYLFRAIAKGSRLDIRLDKPEDPYGSPSMEDTERFLKALTEELEATVGTEQTDNIDIEVSSPGVERVVRIPGELQRFKDVPMTIEYLLDSGRPDTRILQLVECDVSRGTSLWKLADVKRNRAGKGRPKLSNKQAQQRFEIPMQNLTKARLFLDM